MKSYSIYYRGQNINTVQALTEAGAMKKHHKTFMPGTKGTTMAVCDTESRERHMEACEASKAVPGTKAI